MILYVNGDSHTAAAECVVPFAFAEDDGFYYGLGRKPHPENFKASYAVNMANQLYAILDCDAESASSNTRIIRTTREYIAQRGAPDLMIIQWSTWEREEWFIDGVRYQINASGVDEVPEKYQEAYKKFVVNVNWPQKTRIAHKEIWDFHQELGDIPHVFFNGNSDFELIKPGVRYDWGRSYINPYDPNSTFNNILRSSGFTTVYPDSWHFGPDAHRFWADYLLQYCIDNNFIEAK